jgi:hypothetical protein
VILFNASLQSRKRVPKKGINGSQDDQNTKFQSVFYNVQTGRPIGAGTPEHLVKFKYFTACKNIDELEGGSARLFFAATRTYPNEKYLEVCRELKEDGWTVTEDESMNHKMSNRHPVSGHTFDQHNTIKELCKNSHFVDKPILEEEPVVCIAPGTKNSSLD